MKLTKCDRCGKLDDSRVHHEGYNGLVTQCIYQGQENDYDVIHIDLCAECQTKLNRIVSEFMTSVEDVR